MLEIEEPVPAEGSHHPPDGVLEHLTDRASRKMTKLVPHELCAVFVVSPVQKEHVQVCGVAHRVLGDVVRRIQLAR